MVTPRGVACLQQEEPMCQSRRRVRPWHVPQLLHAWHQIDGRERSQGMVFMPFLAAKLTVEWRSR
mgnify:CR=1 FL=1